MTFNNLGRVPDTVLLQSWKDPGTAPVLLRTKDGKIVELTASKLQAWLAVSESGLRGQKYNPATEEVLANQMLARYGLRNSNDLMRYLHTPKGHIMLSLLGEKLAAMVALHRLQQESMVLALRKKYFLRLLFLFLGLAHKKDRQRRALNEFMQQQIDEFLKKQKLAAQRARPFISEEMFDLLWKRYEALQASITALALFLDEKVIALEMARRYLKEDWDLLESEHLLFGELFNDLDSFADELLTLDNHARIARTKAKIAAFEALITDINAQISALNTAGDAHVIRALQQQNHRLRLGIEGLKDIEDVHNLAKKFFTADGEETDSHHKAAFVLRPDLKIVKENGVFYLIGANQDLNSLSLEAKNEARQQFDTLEPQLCTVKNHVDQKYQYDKRQLRTLERHFDTLEEEITLITQQLDHLKGVQKNLVGELNKHVPKLQQTPNTPTVSPNMTAPSPTPTPNMPRPVPGMPPRMTLAQALQALENLQRAPNSLAQQQLERQLLTTFGRPITLAMLNSLNRSLYPQFTRPTDRPELANAPKNWPPTPTPSPFRR